MVRENSSNTESAFLKGSILDSLFEILFYFKENNLGLFFYPGVMLDHMLIAKYPLICLTNPNLMSEILVPGL